MIAPNGAVVIKQVVKQVVVQKVPVDEAEWKRLTEEKEAAIRKRYSK